jgi:vanillate O-demethylase ferredoxin subunit
MDSATLTVTIVDRQVIGDVAFLDFAPTAGRLPVFTPGAHIDLHLPGGLTRQYSLWNAPVEAGLYRIAVRLDGQGRGGSAAAHGLALGAVVTIGAPRHAFALEDAARVVLIGAGIGITPLLSMAAALHRTSRPFRLHYIDRGARAAFRPIILQAPWAESCRFHDTALGRPDAATLLDGCDAETRLYLCGPAGFMAALRQAAAARPIPPRGIHTESFTPPAIVAGGAFTLVTARDGRRHPIPADRSIVDVLRDAGYDITTSCEQGICGACTTPVLGGIPLHQDLVLTDAEHESNRVMTPCCSRSQSPELVLDL